MTDRGGLAALKSSYMASLKEDEAPEDAEKPPARRESLDALGGTSSTKKAEFISSMAADNESRGLAAAAPATAASSKLAGAELPALLERVEASDAGVTALEFAGYTAEWSQFTWLSAPQKLASLHRVAAGSALKVLLLENLGLENTHAAPIAAAVRAHASLERLSVEYNLFFEPALVQISEACEGHACLNSLLVAHQKVGALTQPATIALIGLMERNVRLTRLGLGDVSDPTLRLRLEQAGMKNLEAQRLRRVADGERDTRRAGQKQYDWRAEAARVAASEPFEYGLAHGFGGGGAPLRAARPNVGPVDVSDADAYAASRAGGRTPPADTSQLTYVGTSSYLWTAATEEERHCLLSAFRSNSVVERLEFVNSFITDSLAAVRRRPLPRRRSAEWTPQLLGEAA